MAARQFGPQERSSAQIDEAQRYIDTVLKPMCGPPIVKRGIQLHPCVAHDDREPSLSINTGNIVAIRWNCFGGCDPGDVRDAFIACGADPKQLGGYGSSRWQREHPDRSSPDYDPEVIADAERFRYLRKLPNDLNAWQIRMVVQKLSEEPGNWHPDPVELVGADDKAIKALGRRAGMSSQKADRAYWQWMDYDSKRRRRADRIRQSGEQDL